MLYESFCLNIHQFLFTGSLKQLSKAQITPWKCNLISSCFLHNTCKPYFVCWFLIKKRLWNLDFNYILLRPNVKFSHFFLTSADFSTGFYAFLHRPEKSNLNLWNIFSRLVCLNLYRPETRGNNMSHAETSAHCGAVGNLQLGRDAVYGVRIVSSDFLFFSINPCVEYSVTCQWSNYIGVINHVTKKVRVVISSAPPRAPQWQKGFFFVSMD